MFEDCLVASQSAPISTTKQWSTIGSIIIQTAAAALLAVVPLLHPERLPIHLDPPHILAPLPPKPVIHVKPAAVSSSSTAASVLPATTRTVSLITLLNTHTNTTGDEPSPLTLSGNDSMGNGSGLPDALTKPDPGTNVSVAPTHPSAPLKVSSGISAGMLLAPIRPVYPSIARATHVEGTVIVEAIISHTGNIESLHVISGPLMLRQAAIEAIQAARYQPYRLNGEPTEVQTTITVNFRLSA